MIVHERDNDFIMIKQHDHAKISGEIVLNWKKNFFLRSKLREEADWAIAQHDRAWIPLDEHPLWDDENGRPFSFIDYPLEEKLAAYQRGIEEIASRSLYAGMLCSMHYQSFFSNKAEITLIQRFISEENERQKNLFEDMETDVPYDIYQLHFRRLQFCDDLSLYVCMQEPGTPKEKEVTWFKDGFRQKFDFAPDGIVPQWVDDEQVSLNPFPFESTFKVNIPYRVVTKEEINKNGLENAFHDAKIKYRTIAFIPSVN